MWTELRRSLIHIANQPLFAMLTDNSVLTQYTVNSSNDRTVEWI